MVSYDKVLPIGTVVLLQNGKKRVMILGYQRTAANDDSVIYDYCGCLYPEGYISPQRTLLFNHENIDRIYAMGLQNDEYMQFQEQLRNAIDEYEKKN